MKTITKNTVIKDFPGIVIDPETQRRCALQIDIFKGLGLSGNQVKDTKPRLYQERYYDIEDVIKGRRVVRNVGRPKRGFAAYELLIAISSACAAIAEVATGFAGGVAAPTPIKPAVISRQQATLALMGELGLTVASPAGTQ